jgi:hypothetical protein
MLGCRECVLYKQKTVVLANTLHSKATEFHGTALVISPSIRGGADKSSARPTSRCRRTESIVSLERGVCSCAELQVFSCYRGRKLKQRAKKCIELRGEYVE